MRRVIRLGDATSHGGTVVSATSNFLVMGRPVARLGDKCTCPKKGHHNCVIVEGDTAWTIDGMPVALEGHKISCGAVLISSSPNSGRADSGGSSSAPIFGQNAATNRNDALHQQAYDQHFLLINDQTTTPMENIPYRITLSDGRIFEGVSDKNGLSQKVSADTALVATIEILI